MKYLVTPAPHKYSKLSVNDMYMYTAFALAVCFLYGVINYGYQAFFVLLPCLGTCVVLELIINSIQEKRFILKDFSCLVSGLVLTCIMPINMPWYLGIVAGAITVAAKYLFGGVGNNIFNPAALSRSLIACLFADFAFDLFGENPTVLQTIISGDWANLNMDAALIGSVGGAIGTTCLAMILVAAIVLLVFKVIHWEQLLFSVAGYVAIVWILLGANAILPMLTSGSFLFVTVFMLSDPTTSPYLFNSRCIYALLFGALAALMMANNILGESAVFFALLVANFLAPALDWVFSLTKKGVKV